MLTSVVMIIYYACQNLAILDYFDSHAKAMLSDAIIGIPLAIIYHIA